MGTTFRTGHIMESSIALSIVSCISGYAFLLKPRWNESTPFTQAKIRKCTIYKTCKFDTFVFELIWITPNITQNWWLQPWYSVSL